jgi:hypothetical protein
MSKVTIYAGLFLVVMSAACVDPLTFDVGDVKDYSLVVEGFITDEAGPYEVRVSSSYDVDSTIVKKTPIPVKKLTISDNLGNSEDLTKNEIGVYRTSEGGIQGTIGRAYKLRIELPDGRVYETVPDTMKATGVIDQIDPEIVSFTDEKGVEQHAFDIYFDSHSPSTSDFRFMWKVTMSYQFKTQPWDYTIPCPGGRGTCQAPLDCSGYVLEGGLLVYVKPCTCCDCWISVDPAIPLVSDFGLMKHGEFKNQKAGRLPITWLAMSFGTHVEIQQLSLSEQAYNFWKMASIQKSAINSLFQPVNGKLVGNWVQTSGDPAPVFGLFYASAINKMSTHLGFEDIPDKSIVPPAVLYPFECTGVSNATDVQPKNWQPE